MAAAVQRPSGFEVNPAVRRTKATSFTSRQTYSIAHTAQCKLKIAADRPDRNLRFVLGHAFTLDRVLLRIVEIENQSAKDEFDDNSSQPRKSEIQEEDDARAGIGGGASVQVGETGSLARPQRRVSFSSQKPPSEITGKHGNGRAKSPPPKKKIIPKGYEDDESTSSDDYDETQDFARAANPASSVRPPAGAESDDDDDAAIDDYDQDDDDDDDTALGLTRFASASAAKPRMRSPSPPPLSESDSEEDEEGPKSPPAFPDDVIRGAMVEGEEATELRDLYEGIKSCPCCDKHKDAPHSKGMWTIETKNDDGRNVRYGVIKV